MDKRLESFGWDVINIENGNDMAQVLAALDKLPKPDSQTRRRPIAIISNTLKGIGMIPVSRAQPAVTFSWFPTRTWSARCSRALKRSERSRHNGGTNCI